MKKKALHIILILFVAFISLATLKSQKVLNAEHLHFWADRALYITGEKIEFSGLISGEQSLSKAVYIELITPTGDKINQRKVKLKDKQFFGSIEIPKDALSSYYYLRAYTKWMRNGDHKSYAYILLKIVNPYDDELLVIPDSLINNDILVNGEIQQDSIVIVYQANETISFNKDFEHVQLLNISIIPRVAKPFRTPVASDYINFYQQVSFFPETRGLVLSGVLRSKKSDKKLPFHLVNLHIIGEKDIISVLSDSKGNFHFALPDRYGALELFLIAATIKDDEVLIKIDHDFCVQEIALQVPEFKILDKNKEAILKMVQNQQVFDSYHEYHSTPLQVIKPKAFYGQAFKTLDFSFYVPLDSLEQYFTDISSWVVIKRRKGKRYFQILGEQSELKLYEPLVMVDWVPVDDADRVLAIHPANVEKVDIVAENYIHGDIVYGGIINVMTKNTDFGGLKFPKSGMYLNFEFYSSMKQEKPFDFYRNTYDWTPIILNDSLLKNMELKAPRQKGNYILLIQGIDKNGNHIERQEPFVVEF